MMSAALLMLTGVEQTGKSAGSADPSVDQGELEGISFAKSFNERVGEATLLQGKRTTKESSLGLAPGSTPATVGKKSNAIVATPGERRELTHEGQNITAQGKGKNVANSLGGAVQVVAVTGSIAKETGNDTAAKNVSLTIEENGATDDVSSGLPASSTVLIVPQRKEDAAVPPGPRDEDRPLVLGAGSAFVPKETHSAEKTKENTPARKTAKIMENTPASKTDEKAVGIDRDGISKPAEAASREDALPFPHGMVSGAVVSPKENVRTTDGRLSVTGSTSGKVLVPSEVSSSTAGVLTHKETGHETKAVVADAETETSAPNGGPALTKFGAELETAAVPAGNGENNKFQSVSASGMITAHSISGNSAPGVAPIAVVSSNTPGQPASTKPQVGDTGPHVAGPMVETREHGGLGVIAASTEAIPTMLKATPTTLEVGIQDGTHGWLKVRAEMADSGVVNASVSAASSTGQEMLHRELPAITAYLQQEKVAVNAIAVHAPVVGAEQRGSTGMDGAGAQASQGGQGGREPQQNMRKELPAISDKAPNYRSLHGVDEDGSLSLARYASGGSWLSVRA